MSDGSSIEWTDATWNPIRARDSAGTVGWHCERVSPGCQHCYAETLNEKRFGTGLPYNRKSRGQVDVFLDDATLRKPLSWRKPRRVFVCSMTDLFGEWVPDEVIDQVFAVMALTPQHTFQVLTKRPERMRAYVADMGAHYMGDVDGEYMERWGDAAVALTGHPCLAGDPIEDCGWPLPNVWLGTSVEDQQRADERIPHLLATPAAVRFLSCEPLLGPVELGGRGWLSAATFGAPLLDWVIVGGESGPGSRPCDVAWVRGIVDDCRNRGGMHGVAVFVKQLGARPYSETRRVVTGSVYPSARAARTYSEVPVILRLDDRKGGNPSEWPSDLRVREFPQ